MNKFRVLEAPLVRFHADPIAKAVLADRLTAESLASIDLLDSHIPMVRGAVIRTLAMCALVRFEEPFFDPMGVINLLDHMARYSQHEDVRKECIDALCLLGQKDILDTLTFEPGNYQTLVYRDRATATLFAPGGEEIALERVRRRLEPYAEERRLQPD